MHDIKFITANLNLLDAAIVNRGGEPLAEEFLRRDKARRESATILQNLATLVNDSSKKAGQAKAKGDDAEFDRLRTISKVQKEKIMEHQDGRMRKEDNEWINMLMNIPNFPMDDVPVGKDENDNVELHKSGEPRKFDFEPQEHYFMPSVGRGMDFETAAKISGSRFVILSGAVARVHRALAQFMLDIHTEEHGLLEMNTPVIVNDDALFGTGQLPKFAEDCYKIHSDNEGVENAIDQWLIPTSEVPLTNIVAGKILHKDQLPIRYCAHSLCFRKEAGSAGRDTAGMLRQHQFEKVEMVSITTPEKSREELDIMTTKAENVLKKLGLAFRTVVLCTGDMGFSAQRTHDIEVWLPGQGCYREISSVSVCGDFQARRMNARFREKDGDKPQFVHTLNGSGVAVGRCLIAVLENGQQKDGSVKLPKALHPYLGGKDTINPDGILEKAT